MSSNASPLESHLNPGIAIIRYWAAISERASATSPPDWLLIYERTEAELLLVRTRDAL